MSFMTTGNLPGSTATPRFEPCTRICNEHCPTTRSNAAASPSHCCRMCGLSTPTTSTPDNMRRFIGRVPDISFILRQPCCCVSCGGSNAESGRAKTANRHPIREIPMSTSDSGPARFDAIVVGAGVGGLYAIYRLRELGLRVRAFEAASGVGGTWYWNRYPGARFDSESWTYGYSFSKELLEEWDWDEHFAAQPQTERYLNYVADKFDLRRHIQFNSRVAAAQYREQTRSWEIELE